MKLFPYMKNSLTFMMVNPLYTVDFPSKVGGYISQAENTTEKNRASEDTGFLLKISLL